MRFADRREAGKLLAARLEPWRQEHPIVLALPRGGLPVAAEIARALGAPLDLVLVRKIGVPFSSEFALGAVAACGAPEQTACGAPERAGGGAPELVIDEELRRRLHVTQDYIDEAMVDGLAEIERRRRVYLGQRKPLPIAGRTVILVDDGIATGATMQAALRAAWRRQPARLILAVPVAPADTIKRLAREVDEVVCLDTPPDFEAVGQFYRRFPQLRDEEVIALLEAANKNADDGQQGHEP